MAKTINFFKKVFLDSKVDLDDVCEYCGGTGLDPSFGMCECVKNND